MEVIPAIDIRDGRCVRLAQGDYTRETVFDESPVAVAVRWAALGARRIHVVDLDGAREGRQVNLDIVRRIVQTADCLVQTGGGIRDLATMRAALDSGVDRVVLGETEYGLRFASVVARDNLVATQFHPEKSGEHGLRLYANFLRLALERGTIAPEAALVREA